MTTARLPEELEQRLETAAKAQRKTKSEFVKEALVKYLDDTEEGKSAWELGEPYFGNYGSGDGKLSTEYKQRLRDKIYAKNHPH